jgi:hypothetical protein
MRCGYRRPGNSDSPPAINARQPEEHTMSDNKHDDQEKPDDTDTPAHSTPEEQERLKDFNKGGIPPGSS